MNEQVIVTVSATGEVKIEASGFKGQACRKATEALERALGTIKTRTNKPELFQEAQEAQKAQQGQGGGL